MSGRSRTGGARRPADPAAESAGRVDPRRVVEVVAALCQVPDAASSDRIPFAREAPDPVAEIEQDDTFRARVVRNLLLGETNGLERRIEAEILGVDVDRRYFPFRARSRTGGTTDDLIAGLRTGHTLPRAMLTARLGGDVIGLLVEPPAAPANGVVGIGPAARPDELVESFHLASRAVDTMLAFGLTGVHTFDDLGLLPSILADADVGEALWQRYINPVDDGDPESETTGTIRTWFGCGMHVNRTATRLTLHPNTVRNRLARFEQLADVDLGDATAAMQVWWALQYAALATAAPVTVPLRRAS